MKRKYEVKLQFEVNGGDDSYPVVRFINNVGKPQKETFSDEFDDYLLKNATETEAPGPVTYRVGDKFRDSDGDTCMIVSVGNKKCTVVVVDTKNRSDLGFEYMDVVSVSDQRHITQEELDCMAGPAYAPLTKIEEE